MNILLINPPQEELNKDWLPPLGLGYLAAMLEKAGHKVTIWDAQIELDRLQDFVYSSKISTEVLGIFDMNKLDTFELIGITATTHTHARVKGLLTELKTSKATKVLGGVHYSMTAKQALEKLPVDIVVRSEGEETLLDIANGKPLKDILGITYRQDGEIVSNPNRPFVNLDSLPHPARHLYPMNLYKAKLEGEYKTRCTSILTSRGCPYGCVFCANSAYWKRRLRLRNPKDVVDEMEEVIKDYGIRGFDIWDDTLTVNHEHVKNICTEIAMRKLDIAWYARVRANTVDKGLLWVMKKFGCAAVSFGVESGSPRVLEVINKGITLADVRQVAKATHDLRLPAKAFFMVNHPTETLEDVKLTYKLINELGRYPNINCIVAHTRIYPGTELEAIAKAEGLLPNDYDWNSNGIPHYEHIDREEMELLLRSERRKSFVVRGIRGLFGIRNSYDLKQMANKAIGKGWK